MPARGRTQWQNRYAWAVVPGSAAGEPSPGSYRLTGGVTAPCINVRALLRMAAARPPPWSCHARARARA
eukprot:COSAG01_NODE_11842_length_1848_cov_8.038308_1_plen_68_part_10